MFRNEWFPTLFNEFLDNDLMPRANTTAPAVNVKEDDVCYTMELAAPGIKKEYCRVSINDDGNLCITIENKMEHKDENKNAAKVENGILTVTLPKVKKEEKKAAKAIEIS